MSLFSGVLLTFCKHIAKFVEIVLRLSHPRVSEDRLFTNLDQGTIVANYRYLHDLVLRELLTSADVNRRQLTGRRCLQSLREPCLRTLLPDTRLSRGVRLIRRTVEPRRRHECLLSLEASYC